MTCPDCEALRALAEQLARALAGMLSHAGCSKGQCSLCDAARRALTGGGK